MALVKNSVQLKSDRYEMGISDTDAIGLFSERAY